MMLIIFVYLLYFYQRDKYIIISIIMEKVILLKPIKYRVILLKPIKYRDDGKLEDHNLSIIKDPSMAAIMKKAKEWKM